MASARAGGYRPRAGSEGEARERAARDERRTRLAARDAMYRQALGLTEHEPLPRQLGHVLRGGGRPMHQALASHGGRHSRSYSPA